MNTPNIRSITPYLLVSDGESAANFYKNVFGAVAAFTRKNDRNEVAHMTLQLNDGRLMLSADPEWGNWSQLPRSPHTAVGWLAVVVDDVDATYQTALAAGASNDVAPFDSPWGGRYARFRDPFGQIWAISDSA